MANCRPISKQGGGGGGGSERQSIQSYMSVHIHLSSFKRSIITLCFSRSSLTLFSSCKAGVVGKLT